LNRRNPWEALNRLDVSPTWTADVLIERLNRELPLDGTVRLGIKYVDRNPFGILVRSQKRDARFSLRASPSSTSQTVYWIGTAEAPDLRMVWQVKAFFGEMFLWLRSDALTGDGIGIGFSRGRLLIDQRIQGQRLRLKEVPWRPKDGRVDVVANLVGSHLQVAAEGAQTIDVDLAPSRKEGLVRLSIYDRMHYAAHADDVFLQLTPLRADVSRP
jgi:hypothetical protein